MFQDVNWAGASSVIPGGPTYVAPNEDARDDIAERCAKPNADITPMKNKKNKRQKSNVLLIVGFFFFCVCVVLCCVCVCKKVPMSPCN